MSHDPAKRLLDGIDSPAELKKLPESALPALAQEIREELIESLSETGGHLGPNLGVVELSIALHRVFQTPTDKILFDVSHQGYIHKMLTGRRHRLATMRQHGGLNGFLLRTESEHDCYGAGHAGTALSAALGMAAARDMNGGQEHVVAVAGDAAFTCGISYEALNNVAETTKRFIVILNDNEWSISKNTGAIAEHLNRIATSPAYAQLHDQTAKFVEWIGGKTARHLAHKIEAGVKQILLPGVIFEDLGLRYFGPIDGHDIPLLIRTFEFLKTQNEPVILHILTKKGKGYAPALAMPDKFHGLGKYQQETGETMAGTSPTYSEIFGKTLSDFADHNRKIVAITAAMPTGTGLSQFASRHPDRFYDVGIAEEHAALFAAGMATRGMKPFLTIYSTFMQRAFDMIVHDIALQNLNVALCMDRAGLSGDDGPTHHGLFDIAYLKSIPGVIAMQAKDEEEFVDMLWTMANHHEGPIAIRYPRGAGTGAIPKTTPKLLEIGKAEVLRHGTDVALFGLGNFCEVALEAADLLEKQGIEAAVINPRWIKPLDTGTLEFFARGSKVLCTLEDHALTGGFGSAVAEHLSDVGITTPLVRVGWPDQFIEHGSLPILREKYGMTSQAAVDRIIKVFKSGSAKNQESKKAG
ncbi:MAG: 1-deoxy-D-xylulose-5-phosphate synthase [Chthoniobacterales bacterium]|nr:1-deoxy-D-xylulose-5-phosphate synthase [Chthoniobacterales bacterium]